MEFTTNKDDFWSARLLEFMENHPDILVEQGVDETDPEYYLYQKLKLARSYHNMCQAIAFGDMIRKFDETRDMAYSKLIMDETARKEIDGGSYKSDEYYKGVITTLSELKLSLQIEVAKLPEIMNEYRDFKNTQQ